MKHKIVTKIENIINYQFTNKSLLSLALTHRSIGKNNNERLEFLGDSLINCIISKALFDKFPHAKEGQLSRLRAQIVSKISLSKLGKKLNLGEYISLGIGELKSGGSYRESIIADTVESIIGAIYLDSNINACERCILEWFQSQIDNMSITDEDIKDPKTKLQEYLQKKQLPLPIYSIHEISGDLHNQSFTVSCKVSIIAEDIKGMGNSRRKAEQKAASLALRKLKNQ